MPTFKGTHGTTKLRAEKIIEGGFQISPAGRAGKGIYFWQYHEDSTIARNLAIGWYDSQARRGVYEEKTPECAVIDATFDADAEDYLDCTGEILESIGTLLLNKLGNPTEEDIDRAYEFVIGGIEKKRGRPVLVAKTMVSPPKRMSFPIIQVLPYPGILVVRDESVKIETKIVVPPRE